MVGMGILFPVSMVGLSTSEDIEASGTHIPGFVKVIMILQTLIIFYFVFWTFEEYLNNLYFQNYVNTTLAGGAFGIIAISTVGIFSALASGLYMKLRHTRRELEHVLSSETSASQNQEGSGILAPHVEQHLIEMIRKSSPTDTAGSSTMPVLRREDQPSGQAR